MKAAVRHMVVFNLKWRKDSPEAKEFLAAAKETFDQIKYARDVMFCYEVSPKNGYDYGFSFDFMTKEDYEAYNNHSAHIKFVEEKWTTEVTDFLEIDLAEI